MEDKLAYKKLFKKKSTKLENKVHSADAKTFEQIVKVPDKPQSKVEKIDEEIG